LPALTPARRLVRWLLRGLVRFLVFCFTRMEVRGLENFPKNGPALVVMNHLGDADAIIMLAVLPVFPEALAKIELYDIPVLGALFHAYGVIWVHRGQPDRKALRAVLEGLRAGKFVGVAPEGRESPLGALEEGTEGAAFLAMKADVPLVPVTVTGTQNARLYGNMKRLRRTPVTLRVGKAFALPKLAQPALAARPGSRSPACPPARTSGRCGGQARERSEGAAKEQADRHGALREATRLIMERLACQLPPEYRGVYSYIEVKDD
jgi:1-acyl-sn-glycerol-3-phosphate acyltransferase